MKMRKKNNFLLAKVDSSGAVFKNTVAAKLDWVVWRTRQRLGLRQSSAAFTSPGLRKNSGRGLPAVQNLAELFRRTSKTRPQFIKNALDNLFSPSNSQVSCRK
jgi:hypothetical protein